MRVIVAEHLGMCFGVRDALTAAAAVDDPSRVTIHGDLVHNEEIIAGLRRRGFHVTAEDRRDALPSTEQTLITAHGVSDREVGRLTAAGKSLIDTTCPLVRKVHDVAASMKREGRFVVVIGRADHVEVRGIVGDLDAFAVVARPQDVTNWEVARIGVVCQTTAAPDEVRTMFRRISEANPTSDIRFANTVCRPTRQRQEAVDDLLACVDALVVVGGRHSNNTRKLAERATARGIPSLQVRTADDLDADWCRRFDVLGLTAGTSTPDETIRDVHQTMLSIAARAEARIPA